MFSARYEHKIEVTVYNVDGTAYFSVNGDGEVMCERIELGYGKNAIELNLAECAVRDDDGAMTPLAEVMENLAARHGDQWLREERAADRAEYAA